MKSSVSHLFTLFLLLMNTEWSVVSVRSGWRSADGHTGGGTGLHASQEPPLFSRTIWTFRPPGRRMCFSAFMSFPSMQLNFMGTFHEGFLEGWGTFSGPRSGPAHCYLGFLTFRGRGLSTICWMFAERSLKVLLTETCNEPSGNVPQMFSKGFLCNLQKKHSIFTYTFTWRVQLLYK